MRAKKPVPMYMKRLFDKWNGLQAEIKSEQERVELLPEVVELTGEIDELYDQAAGLEDDIASARDDGDEDAMEAFESDLCDVQDDISSLEYQVENAYCSEHRTRIELSRQLLCTIENKGWQFTFNVARRHYSLKRLPTKAKCAGRRQRT